jgi:hypothetical protein
MARPVILDDDPNSDTLGRMRIAPDDTPVNVGEATEDFHAVPLAQVKQLIAQALEGLTLVSAEEQEALDNVVSALEEEITGGA